MANIWEKAISIFAGNLNLDHSFLVITVIVSESMPIQNNEKDVSLSISYQGE